MLKIHSIKSGETYPLKVLLNKKKFYIVKNRGKFNLIDSICPHQGGVVNLTNSGEFLCPAHRWRFDTTGKCKNVNNQCLSSHSVIQIENDLFCEDLNVTQTLQKKESKVKSNNIEFKLHAHACVEIGTPDFSILMDPWLVGPAFMGSWIQYPIRTIHVDKIKPNIIVITHEHSDHFHIQSLRLFDKSTPIYFPDFTNQRIPRVLRKEGFTNLVLMNFGQTYYISKSIKIKSFNPKSLWNDSIIYLDIDDFHVLNYNDAGINHDVKKYIPEKIDLLMGQFSPGASGFPLTWKNHNNTENKIYYDNARNGILNLISHAVDFYESKAFLPFASFFMLWHPMHREYRNNLGINNISQVKKFLEKNNPNTNVVYLMPGDSFSLENGYKREKRPKDSDLYSLTSIQENIEKCFDIDVFNEFNCPGSVISYQDIVDYFDRFNRTIEILNCSNIRVNLFISDGYHTNKFIYKFSLVINNRVLKINDRLSSRSELDFTIPMNIIAQIIKSDLSWDEGHIGYWCDFERKSKRYEADFWRLLQSPFFIPKNKLQHIEGGVLQSTTLYEVFDKIEMAESVLSRQGMYCLSCGNVYKETLHDAFKIHGINTETQDLILKQLDLLASR